MVQTNQELYEEFTRGFAGMPLSHIWRGYGSAIFFEFGQLTSPIKKRKDGATGNPRGEVGVMIEWSWRIEGKKTIICGSCSNENKWKRGFSILKNQPLSGISILGKLAEVHLRFGNGASCRSFMTTNGHPSWAIFDRTSDNHRTFHSRFGRVEIE